MTQTLENGDELIVALRSCDDADMLCRLRQLESFGREALRATLLSVPNDHIPGDPGPTWATVQKGIGKVIEKISKVWDGEFAPYMKAFTKFYEPHFKTLDSVSKTFEKYQGTADFVRFALETFQDLRKRIDEYLELTGNFDRALVQRTMEHMSPGQKHLFIRKTRLVAAILADCDRELLGSIDELMFQVSEGLNEIAKLPYANFSTDNAKLRQMLDELTWLQKDYDNFPATLRRLAAHMKSWNLDHKDRRYSYALHQDALELGKKFERAAEVLSSRFGR